MENKIKVTGQSHTIIVPCQLAIHEDLAQLTPKPWKECSECWFSVVPFMTTISWHINALVLSCVISNEHHRDHTHFLKALKNKGMINILGEERPLQPPHVSCVIVSKSVIIRWDICESTCDFRCVCVCVRVVHLAAVLVKLVCLARGSNYAEESN